MSSHTESVSRASFVTAALADGQRYPRLADLRFHDKSRLISVTVVRGAARAVDFLTATLLGIASELGIRNVLVVQVSPHTRRTVEEHDAARRLMYRARSDGSLPKGYGGGLLSLHDLRPFPLSGDEVRRQAEGVRDNNFRIEVTEEGIHVYNRDGHQISGDPFAMFERLGVAADGAHAFYLGYELAKAEIAWRLGKRYAQDNPLDWGVAAEKYSEDLTRHAPEGATLEAKRERARARQAERDALEAMEKQDAADRGDDRNDP